MDNLIFSSEDKKITCFDGMSIFTNLYKHKKNGTILTSLEMEKRFNKAKNEEETSRLNRNYEHIIVESNKF